MKLIKIRNEPVEYSQRNAIQQGENNNKMITYQSADNLVRSTVFRMAYRMHQSGYKSK